MVCKNCGYESKSKYEFKKCNVVDKDRAVKSCVVCNYCAKYIMKER